MVSKGEHAGAGRSSVATGGGFHKLFRRLHASLRCKLGHSSLDKDSPMADKIDEIDPPAELSFDGRITFRANDVVNECLNYVYGIL